MSEVNYFVCTYGNFGQDKSFLEKSIKGNFYRLHVASRYPSAMNNIKKGDIILLSNYINANSFIVAWGYAKDKLRIDGASEWRYYVDVDKWNLFNENNIINGVFSYGITWNTIGSGGRLNVKQVKKEWAEGNLSHFEINPVNKPSEHVTLFCSNELTCKTIRLYELLEEALYIPAYQRGYTWEEVNVRKFLDNLEEGVKVAEDNEHNKDSKGEKPYHLGVVILKKNGNKLDIIDGQQRLITLSLIQYCLNKKNRKGNDFEKLSLINNKFDDGENRYSENRLPIHVYYIKQAYDIIQEWVHIKEDINNIDTLSEICVVCIPSEESEDLAYRFFNATNTTGKRLSDYDLLKNHHLRYVENRYAGYAAGKWNTVSEEEQRNVLHNILYRLRKWSYNEPFDYYADIGNKRSIFDHYSVKHDLLDSIYSTTVQTQYNSQFAGGLDFFTYVEDNKRKYLLFEDIKCVKLLQKQLAPHSHSVLCNGIKALSYLYYTKYGELHLSEAVYCIAYCVSKLRNNFQVRRDDLSNDPIFKQMAKALDTSTRASMFIAECLSPEYRYIPEWKRGVKNDYWRSLKVLFNELEKNPDFALKGKVQFNCNEEENNG